MHQFANPDVVLLQYLFHRVFLVVFMITVSVVRGKQNFCKVHALALRILRGLIKEKGSSGLINLTGRFTAEA